ncbi:MAG: hypothetical protein ACD_62C00323G0003 [uncultured bacterium]|nr:MAG: hypothetical protein ACD_62C00323G0003 [uncultured bacterium]
MQVFPHPEHEVEGVDIDYSIQGDDDLQIRQERLISHHVGKKDFKDADCVANDKEMKRPLRQWPDDKDPQTREQGEEPAEQKNVKIQIGKILIDGHGFDGQCDILMITCHQILNLAVWGLLIDVVNKSFCTREGMSIITLDKIVHAQSRAVAIPR